MTQLIRADETHIPAIKELIDRNFDEVLSEAHSAQVIEKFKNENSIESLLRHLRWKMVCAALEKALEN